MRNIGPMIQSETQTPANSAGVCFYRVSRRHQESTAIEIGDIRVADGEFVIIAGPCSVESREQILETALWVSTHGAALLRGGAFKPRTGPYAFQGLGWEGVDLLVEAGRASNLPTVSEVMAVEQVERMALSVDVLQIGARNMQNFDLLRAVGRTTRPVLLKRGLSATIEELLSAAEYILAEGNPNVILCERGIRTFERVTRNTLDLSAVPVLREYTHLPVLVDPSHGVGVRRWIPALCRAAKAVGAHGLLLEIHPHPAEARSDGEQAITFGDFETIVEELDRIPISSHPTKQRCDTGGIERVRGIRGAVSVTNDDADQIKVATKTLLAEMTVRNAIKVDDLISVFFSLTPDLHAAFPAAAARELGWFRVPILHVAELEIVGALPRCIRVLIHTSSSRPADTIEHVYLGEAVRLRPDLAPAVSHEKNL